MKMCSFHVTVSLAKAKFVKLHIGAMKGSKAGLWLRKAMAGVTGEAFCLMAQQSPCLAVSRSHGRED